MGSGETGLGVDIALGVAHAFPVAVRARLVVRLGAAGLAASFVGCGSGRASIAGGSEATTRFEGGAQSGSVGASSGESASGAVSPGQGGDASTSDASMAQTVTTDAASAVLGGDGSSGAAGGGEAGASLASLYSCDVGLAADPAVVWVEDFEEGAVSAVTSRYESAANPAGMALIADVPGQSCGKASMKLTSGMQANATDLYKRLVPGHDEWFVRWYAKYQAGVTWHHTGVWMGGYDPPTPYPNPQAGLKPVGNDRFSVSIEPVYGVGQPNPRFDYYNYWMQMHSWMDVPQGDTAYYGNSLVHQTSFTADDNTWMCLEVHIKLNTDVSSSSGALLEVWKNDALIQHFDPASPVGCWIKDKFCASGADATECTDYPNLCAKPFVPLDLEWRSTTALQLNVFWPQNYITDGSDGSVQYDDMVVATRRVGCLQK